MILDTSSSEIKEKALSMVGVFAWIWSNEIVEEDFKAVCSLRILSEKKVANICDSDWEEASEGRRGVGLTFKDSIMEFQSLQGFEEEEAIKEALKRFLAAIIAEWYLLEAVRSLRWWGEWVRSQRFSRWRRTVLRTVRQLSPCAIEHAVLALFDVRPSLHAWFVTDRRSKPCPKANSQEWFKDFFLKFRLLWLSSLNKRFTVLDRHWLSGFNTRLYSIKATIHIMSSCMF